MFSTTKLDREEQINEYFCIQVFISGTVTVSHRSIHETNAGKSKLVSLRLSHLDNNKSLVSTGLELESFWNHCYDGETILL